MRCTHSEGDMQAHQTFESDNFISVLSRIYIWRVKVGMLPDPPRWRSPWWSWKMPSPQECLWSKKIGILLHPLRSSWLWWSWQMPCIQECLSKFMTSSWFLAWEVPIGFTDRLWVSGVWMSVQFFWPNVGICWGCVCQSLTIFSGFWPNEVALSNIYLLWTGMVSMICDEGEHASWKWERLHASHTYCVETGNQVHMSHIYFIAKVRAAAWVTPVLRLELKVTLSVTYVLYHESCLWIESTWLCARIFFLRWCSTISEYCRNRNLKFRNKFWALKPKGTAFCVVLSFVPCQWNLNGPDFERFVPLHCIAETASSSPRAVPGRTCDTRWACSEREYHAGTISFA